MPVVTINDLILLQGATVTPDTPIGTTFAFSDNEAENQFAGVVGNVVFTTPDGSFGETIPLGSTTEIDGIVYTLNGVLEFWGEYSKTNPETGEEFTQQGQTVTLVLDGPEGEQITFVAPSDTFNTSDPWQGGIVNSITTVTEPFVDTQVGETPGAGSTKLGADGRFEIPCFVAGTLIDTAQGRKRVEDLRPGDLVLTRDHGYRALIWTGQRAISAQELDDIPAFKPILIRAGALGLNLPEVDTRVSPEHRVLVCGTRAEVLFGEKEVLVPAAHLVGQAGIEQVAEPVTYVHIMFDAHEIVLGDGMWSESFQPAEFALDSLGEAQRAEIFALFPELRKLSGQKAYASARMTLKAHEARLLFAA